MSNKNQEIIEIKKRLDKLESQLIFLSRRMGIEMKETTQWAGSPKILELLKAGKNTEAIKEFVNETGASLKDAKAAIESINI